VSFTSTELRLERLSWRRIAEARDAGYRTVVLPCGAIEQHGPHLPLLVDTAHADALAVAVARRMDRCLVAPTLSLGFSPHHMHFAGTVTLRSETLESLIEDCAASLAAHGFERICCFSTHGGNFGILRRVERRIDSSLAPQARFVAYSDQAGYLDVWRWVVDRRTGRANQVGGHADIAESSIALALTPDLVDVQLAAPGYAGEVDAATSKRIQEGGVEALSENGVIGDPTGMSAELGHACIDAMATMLGDYFRVRLEQDGS
jgi:creatinine amidohydrolase